MPSKPEKANADRKRRYYEQHDRELARSRAYYEANAAGKNNYSRNYYQKWKALNPDGLWLQWLKKAHDMRGEDWLAMWDSQRGLCYLCEQPLPEDRSKIAVDHAHAHCGKKRSCRYCRRGLAHHWCNMMIGMLGEDLALMRYMCAERIIENFERAQIAVLERVACAPAQGMLDL